MTVWLTGLLITVAIGVGIAIVVSRGNGSMADHDLKSLVTGRPPARIYIAQHLRGRRRRQGQWVWDTNGEAYYVFLGMLWQVPSRWSLRAFNLVMLDKAVNGDD